jgi:glycosyltransferase involved in cell wall biosynthesis
MRILYCMPTLGYGGAERQLCYLVAELVRLGHEVHVAVGRGGAFRERIAWSGARVHEVGARGHHDPRLLFNLVRLVASLKPDAVQTCLMQMDVAGGVTALLTRTPWVLQEPSAVISYPSGWKNRLRRMLGTHADAIVANSQQGGAYWQTVAAARRHVVRSGLPLEEIDAVAALKADRPTVLFAGRLDDGKNVGTLIDALGRIADVDFAAVICGDGPRRAELERMAAERGLAGRVHFCGYVSNLLARMKTAAVLVSLSRYEGCSNVVLEAMACGCPLVLSDIAAHREVLDDDAAWFVPSDDPAAAAEAIRTALHSRDAARKRAKIARALVEAWCPRSRACQYEAIYEAVRTRR